jgi:hypothetical protein
MPPVDKTPPQLKLLGGGTAAVTPSGAIILMEDVAWRSSWVDAGAAALDAVDGNLTSRVQAFGAGGCSVPFPALLFDCLLASASLPVVSSLTRLAARSP